MYRVSSLIDKTRLQRQFNNQDKACFHTPMPPNRVACAYMHVALRVCILSSDVAFRRLIVWLIVQCWAFAFMSLLVGAWLPVCCSCMATQSFFFCQIAHLRRLHLLALHHANSYVYTPYACIASERESNIWSQRWFFNILVFVQLISYLD